MMESEKWVEFCKFWQDLGWSVWADQRTGGDISISDALEKHFKPTDRDVPIPDEVQSGDVARKHFFGRTDLGDHRNAIRDTSGEKIGVAVHVKKVEGQNILTIEDLGGECQVVHFVTASKRKVTVNLVKLPLDKLAEVESKKVDL